MTRKVKSPGPSDGRTTRWDEHRDQRRATLIEAAVSAIDEHGAGANIAQIAATAGVSKPVLYRYFADKDELHAAVGSWGAQQVLDRVIPPLLTDLPIRERIAVSVDGYLAVIAEHPALFQLVVHHRTDAKDPLADGRKTITSTFARVIGDGLRHLGVDAAGAEPWAHGLVGLGLSTGEWWLGRQTMSQEAVGRYLTEFIWHAFEGIAEEYGVPLSTLDAPPPAATPIRRGHKA
ncbi:hypothetical protein ASG90_04555 [Nocardioides sp. Soil797]|nr:hypothetical protein ASG90_04555 [Nocardioides sp. Soil797]